MEKFVTNQALSMQLKEAGSIQRSQFMWVKYELRDTWDLYPSDLASDMKLAVLAGKRTGECAAYLTDELNDMLLGVSFHIYKSYGNGICVKDVFLHRYPKYPGPLTALDVNELPNLLAQLWLWCKQNGVPLK